MKTLRVYSAAWQKREQTAYWQAMLQAASEKDPSPGQEGDLYCQVLGLGAAADYATLQSAG